MATVRANAPKSISGNYKSSMSSSKSRNTGPPLPQLYIDTIAAAFGEEADLHRDVLRISPDAMPIEQRIAYFKRGREIMKEAGSHIIAPRDLSPPIRARLKAINMTYDILSNPEWQQQYLARGESPRIKSNGVRFNDHIEERVFEREPWEEDYMRERRERRMQRYSNAQESFWSDFLMDMENFELGLDDFMQAFPDRISKKESKDSADVPTSDESVSSFPDTQSFSSWLSPKLETHKKEPSRAGDFESTSYLSSFNPFGGELAKNTVSSPTSLDQELAQSSQTSGNSGKKKGGSSNPFRDAPDSSNTCDDVQDSTNPFDDELDTTNPFEDGNDVLNVTNSFEDGNDAFNTTNPSEDSTNDITNPFSGASDARFGIGTFQYMQKERKARRAPLSTDREVSEQLMGAFDHSKASNAFDGTKNKKQSHWNSFPSTSGHVRRQSKTNRFDDEPADPKNDISGDQTSVFDGLEDAWDDEGVHVEGVSVISDLSESVVAKRARQKQKAFNPFGNTGVTKEDTRGSSQKNASSLGNPNWGGSEGEEADFASALASRFANLVADCERNSNAVANFKIDKDFFPSLFTAEESEEKKRKSKILSTK